MEKISLRPLYRSALIARDALDEEGRTAALSFSSEEPVERVFGNEVLDHSPKSVRLGRLQNGGPLLVDHDPSDVVGTVEQAQIGDDRRGRAVVRFGRSARAEEIWRDVVDGIRRHISVGYRVHRMKAEGKDDGVYRVVDWEPLEVSVVAIPADATVGVGRDDEPERPVLIERSIPVSEDKTPAQPAEPVAAPAVDIEVVTNDIRAREQQRIRDLSSLGKQYAQFGGEELARECVATGKGAADMQAMLLERMNARVIPQHGEIGMTPREVKRFSITRLINALANPNDRKAQAAAAFELESGEAARTAENRVLRSGAQATIPYDVLSASNYLQRDLIVGTAASGGYTVGTDNLVSSFIELLRNQALVIQAGATVLSGLSGSITIPSLATGATAYWVNEGTAPTEGAMTFGQVSMQPKTVGAWVDVSRKLMIQSGLDVEAFIRRELVQQVAVEMDRVALNGNGTSPTPLGVLQSTSVTISTVGSAQGEVPTWAHVVKLETDVGAANVSGGRMAYFCNNQMRGALKVNVKSTSAVAGFIWEGGGAPVNGYPVYVTNQIPSNFVKGTTSSLTAMVFGDWSQILIGQWGGGIDVLVDPYTASNAGTVRVVALSDMDVALRRAAAFGVNKQFNAA